MYIIIIVTEVKDLTTEKNKIIIQNEFDVRSYFLIRQQLEDLAKQYHSFITNPKNLVPFCNPGRLVKVSIFIFLSKTYSSLLYFVIDIHIIS